MRQRSLNDKLVSCVWQLSSSPSVFSDDRSFFSFFKMYFYMLSLLSLFLSVASRFPFPISLSASVLFSALRGPENVPRAPFLSPSSSVQFINLSLGIWQSETPLMLKVASLCASFSQFRDPGWTLQLRPEPWCPSRFESSDILVLTKG